MSEIFENDVKEGKQILASIFKSFQNDQNKLYPIIENSTNISNLLLFLKDKKNNISEKIEIIYFLFQLFKLNNVLLPVFMKKKVSNIINLYEPLIDLYFCKDEKISQYKEIIEQFFKMIRSNITLNKAPIEYIYQKLSLYFDNKDIEENEKLDERQILKYLNIFSLFYTGKFEKDFISSSDTIQNDENDKQIKNYIYFNGLRSGISLALNETRINVNTDYPNLKNGLSFIMWFYIDERLIKYYEEMNRNTEKKLVVINISGEQIKLVFKNLNTLLVSFNDSDPKIFNIKFKNNDWNNICFSIKKNDSNLPIKLFINSEEYKSILTVSENFSSSSKINTIKLFENFIGQLSSFIIITKELDQKEVNYFNSKKYGFYKNKILFDFILSNEKKYFLNCKNYKYYKKFINNKSNSFYNLHSKKQNLKNMIAIFCPFAYNKEENQIDDIFGNFIGILGENDGVNYFENNSKEIMQLGGINNLLPIMELMHSTISKSKIIKYNLTDESILTQNTFCEFLNIIKNIIIDHNQNLIDMHKSHFFSSISLFIEKFPKNLFTSKILEIFLEIGKETFQNMDKLNLIENYINEILLNEKIIIKFNTEDLLKLWKNIYSFFTSDDTQIKYLFNIKNIVLLLRLFDEKKYNEYCCKRHANFFKDNNDGEENYDLPIMKPEMNERLDELFKIIQIYINKLCGEEQTVNLLRLLSLDLSPCLQKKIVQIYINYFANQKIELNVKGKAFDFLIKNYFIELLEYTFSISLLDIRVEILSLFKIIFDIRELKHKFQNYMGNEYNGMNNFYTFVSENLLPEQLYIERDEKDKNNLIINTDNLLTKDNTGNEKKELIPFSTYFNKKYYEKEVFNIWNFLQKWTLYRVPPPSKIDKKKDKKYNNIYNFVIEFCISFSSKSPFNYIDLFILILISYFKDESIQNRQILYTNKNLYPWLIETIYNFHNSEYSDSIYKKEDIISIKKNSINLFEEFFVHQRPHEEINKRIYYIIRYAIHLRKLNGDSNNKKVAEITRITRLLLQKIMDVSSLHMNYKAKACFDFIVFHKNFAQLTGSKKFIKSTNTKNITEKDFVKQNTEDIKNLNFDFINVDTDFSINNNDIIIEKDEEDINDKDNGNFKINKNPKSISISLNLNALPNSEKDNNDNKDSKKNEIIPSYIFKNLHFPESEDNNLEKIEEKGKTLKLLWEDFSLYDSIIDYYSSNIWGTENLAKKVKADIEQDIMLLSKNLLKEYGDNKSYRNILLKDITKCLNIKYSEDSTKTQIIQINILNINVILLCIAIEISQDYYERMYLEGKFQQFIIFCIMASININSNGIYYNLIQDKLYDALGFAFLYLKKMDKKKYNEIIVNLILPIIDTDEVKKFRLFKNKKYHNKNSAISRLFELREIKKEDLEEYDDYFKKADTIKGLETSRNTYNVNYKNYDRELYSKNNLFLDDSNLNKKKINIKPVFKGNKDLILNHIFEEHLEKVKEEMKYNFGYKTNYKNIYNNNYIIGNCPTEEKLRLNKVIKKIIPLYEKQIKNYANKEYLNQKKRRNYYKANKAKLFSWKGFWSNKYLFYEHSELLKLKTKNHYTKEMIKPLLVPILDIDYYSPPFKQFDDSKLFNKNNYFYKINLDIDKIFIDEDEIENEINENIIIETKEENDEFKIDKNKYRLNYLECLYKLSYNEIWEKYKLISNKKIIFEKIISEKKEPYSALINSKKMSKTIENIQRENIYNCCLVKLTHHIKGYISTEKSRIRFIYSSDIKEEEIENDLNYDKDMHCCFGSIFKSKKNDKDKVVITIEYANITYIFMRQYFYVASALEIYLDNNKSYFFNFKSNRDLVQFQSDILHHIAYNKIKTIDYKGKKILGYHQINPNTKKKNYYVSHKMEEWQNNNISTLEYLMWLNIYSGRSFNDLTQYPIFPWIITNYTDNSQELSIKNDFRDLNLPVGMLEISEKGQLRKETFIETYESLKNDLKEMFPDFSYQDYLKKGDEYLEHYKNKKLKKEKDNPEEITNIEFNQIPYFFGSHYSNATYVSHFLCRILPYTYITIEIQGGNFDDPERMFTSMERTFISTSSLKDDVRELIPEFYMLPELFLNKNNINLDQNKTDSDNNLIVINDVKLPIWSKNNAINFVVKLRRFLETNYISNNINKWIDLIFGVVQRGEKAEEYHNIFQAHSYEKNVKIDSIKDIDSRNALMRLYEMGVTPFQIFESESKNKIKNYQNTTLDESKNITFKLIKSSRFKQLNNIYDENKQSDKKDKEEININTSSLKIVKMDFIDSEKLIIFTNKNQWYTLKINQDDINSKNNKELKMEESNYNKFKNNSIKFACSYFISNIQSPIIVFNDGLSVIKGGFWDGRLELNNLHLENKEDQSLKSQVIFNPHYSPVITMQIAKQEKILLCGTKNGILITYIINEKIIEYKDSLYLFDDEIISISINETLNMFAVSSKDGFVNLHILPSFSLVRTICLNKNKNEDNNILYADNIFLSSSPLACITLYLSSKKIFKSFTINGEFICEIEESDNSSKIKSPIIYKNNNFQDILIYGTNNGFIKIRKFPEMALINSIEVFPGEEINAICLSPDKKYCFVWSTGNMIAVLKDSDIN